MTVLSMRDYIIFVSLCFSLTLFYLPVNLRYEYTREEELEKIPSREYSQDLKIVREEMNNQFSQIMSMTKSTVSTN
jgi:hypothetical protein